MKNLALAALLLVAVFGLVGCEAMPVTVSPYAGYGGSGIDYGPGGSRSDPSHVWQAGVSASFVIGGRGAVANAVPAPALPTQLNVSNNAQNSASNSNSNSNSNTNSSSGGNVNNGVINNGTINGGIK